MRFRFPGDPIFGESYGDRPAARSGIEIRHGTLGMGLREMAHIVDWAPLCIGFLCPLWDKKQSDLRRQTRQHDSDECGLAHAARLASMFLRHSPSYPPQQHETPAEVTFSNTKRALPIGKRPQILLPQFSGFIFRRWLRRADGPLGRQLVRLASSR